MFASFILNFKTIFYSQNYKIKHWVASGSWENVEVKAHFRQSVNVGWMNDKK